jgi:hypothetical protein
MSPNKSFQGRRLWLRQSRALNSNVMPKPYQEEVESYAIKF